ncbi:SRPBCC family protein, partial [Methylobacterium sp. J-078]|uniref:SRPBCC family protein n=1 Tax=Methylobacterium sp. J-078 TaxID=2836657 RepID=UPI001FB9065B
MSTISWLVGFLAAFAAKNCCGFALAVTRSNDMEAPTAAVWALIGDFCAIEKWHPLVKRCTI